jgi:hypothetical protein
VLIRVWSVKFFLSCKIVYRWVTTNCCFMRKSALCCVNWSPRQNWRAHARACAQLLLCMLWRHMGARKSWISFLTTAIYVSELSVSRPGRFNSGDRAAGASWMGDCGGSQSRCGCFGGEKCLFCAGLRTPGYPTRSLVSIMTTPFLLLEMWRDTYKNRQLLLREVSFKA